MLFRSCVFDCGIICVSLIVGSYGVSLIVGSCGVSFKKDELDTLSCGLQQVYIVSRHVLQAYGPTFSLPCANHNCSLVTRTFMKRSLHFSEITKLRYYNSLTIVCL